MEVDELDAMIVNLLNVEKEKETNRKIWDDRAKQIITNCFIEIVNRFKIGWEMGTDDNPNLDAVYLYFTPKFSEFRGIDGDNKIKLKKAGGILIFFQTFNGEISIKIESPTIELIKPNKKFRIIDNLSPFEITKATVFKYVGEFLLEMARWESEN